MSATKSIFTLLLACITAFNCAYCAEQINVIVILADDLGYGDLGCYGHPKYKTPNLDRMAAEGARFTQFNCPMAYCAPTRAALLTGRYPFRCGMVGNPAPDGAPQQDALALPASEILLPQLFKRAGYATAMFGKWHLGHQKVEHYPLRRGFDEYFGILYSNDMRPVQHIEGEKVVEYPVIQANLTKRYTERALGFIERNTERPFFLYLAHPMPHKPLAASEAFYKKSGVGLFGDVMAELDWSVGEVLSTLKALGLERKTLVIFTSDNGPFYGGSTGGLRGMKGSTYEGGYRVPLIVWWPGRIPAGHVTRQLGVTMDLFATALKVTGIPLPNDRVIDGKDILPLCTSDAPSPHEAVLGGVGSRMSTVRDARWKLHVHAPVDTFHARYKAGRRPPIPREPDGVTIIAPWEQYKGSDHPGLTTGAAPTPMQLFDLQDDPGEQRDRAERHPEIVNRLKAAFNRVLSDENIYPR